MTKVHQVVAIIAGLFTIAVGLSNIFGLPLPSFLLFWKHTIVRISDSPEFLIEAIKDKNNVVINKGDSFSYRFGIPLTIRGKTELPDAEMVWVVVADQYSWFYLQHPRVNLQSGEWVAVNVRPGEGIKRIVFVKANAAADRFFQRKVDHYEWGKFRPLPNVTLEVALIGLQ
jgi:hypothetical protein